MSKRTKGKNQEVSPIDFLNLDTEYADKSLQESRYKTCTDCEHFRKLTKQCKLCGCFMHLKVKLLQAECPIDKW